MEQDILFNQKRAVAQASLAIKVKVHGFNCEIETPVEFLTSYGEESGHIEYNSPKPSRVLITNSTQRNMKTSNDLLNSTENPDLYLVMFEDDVLPRDTRIKVYMQNNSFRQLQIRDNFKNEGTFVVHQQLVPCINTVDTTDPNISLNIPNTSVGNNL